MYLPSFLALLASASLAGPAQFDSKLKLKETVDLGHLRVGQISGWKSDRYDGSAFSTFRQILNEGKKQFSVYIIVDQPSALSKDPKALEKLEKEMSKVRPARDAAIGVTAIQTKRTRTKLLGHPAFGMVEHMSIRDGERRLRTLIAFVNRRGVSFYSSITAPKITGEDIKRIDAAHELVMSSLRTKSTK